MAKTTPRGNIVDYVASATQPFDATGPTDVDLLAFASLSYFALERLKGAVAEDGSVSINSPVNNLTLADLRTDGPYAGEDYPELLVCDDGYVDAAREMHDAVVQSPRFASVAITQFACERTDNPYMQFSATAFRLPNGAGTVVAYRGTDVTAIGWYDSMNLIFLGSSPAADRAPEFLAEAARNLAPGEPLYVCGHSKGGILAELAVIRCDAATASRVTRCVSFDSPAPFTFGGEPNPELEALDQELLARCATAPAITRYAFTTLLALSLERRENHRPICINSVDGKPRHCVYHTKVDNGAFEVFEPSQQDIAEADKTAAFLGQLNHAQRELFSDVFAVCCDRTNCRVDLSLRFLTKLVREYERIVEDMNDEQRAIGESITAIYQRYWD